MESLPTFGAECPDLWARLRDRSWLWHTTSLHALARILSDGAIRPNTGQLRDTFHQSGISYSRHLNAVSLFDFATEDEAYIFDHEEKWRSVLFRQMRGSAVLIRVRSGALDATALLSPSDLQNGNDPRLDALRQDIRRGRMFLPAVEALHIGPIAIGAFDGFVLIGRGDLDACPWVEPKNLDDPVPELLEISARWEADREKRRAERWARGDFIGLSDLLEATRQTRSKHSKTD
jgi:hypothetical protein